MEFEWCDEKNNKNFEKHGLYFDHVIAAFAGHMIEKEDSRRKYGEKRYIAIGMVDNHVLAIVYTWRSGIRRLISARKARKDERRAYSTTLAGLNPDQES
ncbi:BrnT family toxin [Skermanella sp. TT6]|uniref:BrnT family toxin n=1 Tax=Skermanella cutis TaxID=2775420 RepID=A0ABX7B041_9PROT|nr:BrnT family toxin [Skermanella sp. TT6]QQP87487.1 BrnT family toxin [Skermanella sp. TT6]